MSDLNQMRNHCNCGVNHGNNTVQCPTLRIGNRGSAVAFVQRLLRQRGYNVPIDGIFGNMTRNAVTNFQRRNNLSQTGMVDDGTWRALGVTCLPGQYYPGSSGNIVDTPQTLPSFPSTPVYPGAGEQDIPQILPSFPDAPVWQESELDGFNYTWEEVGNYRYILTTNKSRYAQGETVYITFRKRNISDDTQVLRYPSDELFDFYISDRNGIELYR
ncbi:MAG: peptidoglycan-binding protein, partial [Peptococcaceae bacterium]|nr:peptidoglycan-binding protein [Peptococcaceae bacterium]